jgi:cyclophilin family peptidyl-prolyl cis-trans isomerase
MLSIVCRAVSTLPAPRQCDSWAKSGECERNPGFMWAECADACKALGLKEPWADADEQASNGLPPSTRAQTLELRFPHDSGFAPLRILLRPDLAPKTVAALVQHIGEAGGTPAAATFYRNEAVPAESPGQCGDILCGPYSLIQGRLDALLDTPSETTPLVRKGFVARIQNGHDFFIALDDHSEWGHSFTVWGDMRHDAAGMATLEAISKLPYHEQKAAGASTIMRLLDVELETRAAIVDERPALVGDGELRQGRAGSSIGGTGGGGSSSSSSTVHVEEMEL